MQIEKRNNKYFFLVLEAEKSQIKVPAFPGSGKNPLLKSSASRCSQMVDRQASALGLSGNSTKAIQEDLPGDLTTSQ